MNDGILLCVDSLGVQGRKVHLSGTDGCQQVLLSLLYTRTMFSLL